jgi:hypothetical protein
VRKAIFNAMDEAENRLGRPPSYMEVAAAAQVMYGHWGFKFVNSGYVIAFMQNLYREDLFYVDRHFVYWSTNLTGDNKQGFEKF